MPADSEALDGREHPAPHRHAVPHWRASYALAAAPIAWFLQENVSYAVASRLCRFGAEATASPAATTLAAWLALLGALAAGVALSGAWMGWRDGRRVVGEHPGSSHVLLEVGEGRTRFVAICGVLTSLGFALAIAFTTATSLAASLCAR